MPDIKAIYSQLDNILEKQNCKKPIRLAVIASGDMGRELVTQRGMRKLLGVKKIFYVLSVVVVTRLFCKKKKKSMPKKG